MSVSVVARNAVLLSVWDFVLSFQVFFHGSVKVPSVLGLFGGPDWVTQTSWFGFSAVYYERTKCCPFHGLALIVISRQFSGAQVFFLDSFGGKTLDPQKLTLFSRTWPLLPGTKDILFRASCLLVSFPLLHLNSVQQMVSGELAEECLQTGFERHGLPPQRAPLDTVYPTREHLNSVQRMVSG